MCLSRNDSCAFCESADTPSTAVPLAAKSRASRVKSMASQLDAATRESLLDQYLSALRNSLGVNVNRNVLESAEGG